MDLPFGACRALGRALLARDAHESRVRVGEKKFTINKLKRWEEFGGEAAGAHGPSWPLASGL